MEYKRFDYRTVRLFPLKSVCVKDFHTNKMFIALLSLYVYSDYKISNVVGIAFQKFIKIFYV